MFLKTNFAGDPNIGLYGFATDKYCLAGITGKDAKKVKDVLEVKVISALLMETPFVSLFSAGNSSAIIVPDIIEKHEIKELKKNLEVHAIKTKYTCLGNLIVMNDSGIVLSPLLRKEKTEIEQIFGLTAAVTTISNSNVIGNLAIATNKGCLTTPKIKDREKKVIEKTLNVPLDEGTVSFGSFYVRSGIIANSHGFIVSSRSSGIEMGKVNEVLGFL
jgi:translation initiation factor 6